MATQAERLRQAMSNGRPFTKMLAKDFGLTPSNHYLYLKYLQALGYRFQDVGTGTKQCTNPDHEPTAADRARYQAIKDEEREIRQARTRDEARERSGLKRPANTRPPLSSNLPAVPSAAVERAPIPPTHSTAFDGPGGLLGVPEFDRAAAVNFRAVETPQLGSMLSVFAMKLEDDGSLRLGIQNGTKRYVVEVIAEVER